MIHHENPHIPGHDRHRRRRNRHDRECSDQEHDFDPQTVGDASDPERIGPQHVDLEGSWRKQVGPYPTPGNSRSNASSNPLLQILQRKDWAKLAPSPAGGLLQGEDVPIVIP